MLYIRPASRADVPLILELIRALAEYEKLADRCVANEQRLDATLFGDKAYAETLIAEWNGAQDTTFRQSHGSPTTAQ